MSEAIGALIEKRDGGAADGCAESEPKKNWPERLAELGRGALASLSLAAICAALGVSAGQGMWAADMARLDAGASWQIEQMRLERAWMASEGLGRADRRIGSLSKDQSEAAGGAYAGRYPSLFGHALAPGVEPLAAAVFGRFVQRSWGVGPWLDDKEATRVELAGDSMARVYRHEEAHALRGEQGLQAGAPAAWPAEAARVALAEANGVWGHWEEANWRAQLMARLREEAFADAYACLASARRGQAAMLECALQTHALRLISSKERTLGWTSLTLAGNSHGVEMASHLVARLDGARVAKLSQKELLELAGGVADESLGWSLARQATLIGFFDETGFQKWWAPAARRLGASEREARAWWESWKASAMGERPEAVFGRATLRAGGQRFELGKAAPEQGRRGWRFDGFGGALSHSAELDEDAKKRSDGMKARLMAMLCEPHLPEACAERWPKSRERRVTRARKAALEQHARLAEGLGLDMRLERDRLERIARGDEAMERLIGDRFNSGAWTPGPGRKIDRNIR